VKTIGSSHTMSVTQSDPMVGAWCVLLSHGHSVLVTSHTCDALKQ